MRSCILLVISTAAVLAAGCTAYKEEKPSTYKVEGKVIYTDGKAYAQGGGVEFRHETVAGVTCTGEIQSDGTFSLRTVTAQHKLEGAPEGSYHVTIIPKSKDHVVQPIALAKKYVIIAGDNNLTVHADD